MDSENLFNLLQIASEAGIRSTVLERIPYKCTDKFVTVATMLLKAFNTHHDAAYLNTMLALPLILLRKPKSGNHGRKVLQRLKAFENSCLQFLVDDLLDECFHNSNTVPVRSTPSKLQTLIRLRICFQKAE